MCNAVPGDSIFLGGKFIPHESLGCRMKSLDFGLEAAISLCCTWPDYEMRHLLDRGVKGFTFSELKAGNFLSNSHFPGVWDSYFFLVNLCTKGWFLHFRNGVFVCVEVRDSGPLCWGWLPCGSGDYFGLVGMDSDNLDFVDALSHVATSNSITCWWG